MSTEEPAAKKAKTDVENGEPTGWEDHAMNISEAIMKADEGKHLNDLKDADVSTLQGIGKFSTEVIKSLGLTTIADLAQYKFFLLARAIKTLAETEVKGDRPASSVMNIDRAVDKDWEAKSLTEIVDAPTEALEGIGEDACELLESLGVKSIGDLADFKYCRRAEAIVNIAAYEEVKTAKQRKLEAALRKLA
jgi:nucleotidyltransferase/DNA polymerase involved in DNA repair